MNTATEMSDDPTIKNSSRPASTMSPLPVSSPDISNLSFGMDNGVKVFELIAEPVKRRIAPWKTIDCWGFEQYELMTASFIRVLVLERMLYENETAYIDALEQVWTGSVALRGFLLQGGLDSPSSVIESRQARDANRFPSISGGMGSLNRASNLTSR